MDVFQTLADPSRRAIIDSLRNGELAVNDIVASVASIDQSGVSRHLRILTTAGFVAMRPDGPKRLYSLRPEPFHEIDNWVSQYRQLWNQRLDRFERALEKRQQMSSKRSKETK